MTGDPAEIAALGAELAADPNDTPVLRFCRALLAPDMAASFQAEHET